MSSVTKNKKMVSAGAGNVVKEFLARNGALVGLILLCIILAISTPAFLTGANLLNVGIQASTIAILAFGETFAIVSAGIDLSVGAVAAFSSMVVAWLPALVLEPYPAWPMLFLNFLPLLLPWQLCPLLEA